MNISRMWANGQEHFTDVGKILEIGEFFYRKDGTFSYIIVLLCRSTWTGGIPRSQLQ